MTADVLRPADNMNAASDFFFAMEPLIPTLAKGPEICKAIGEEFRLLYYILKPTKVDVDPAVIMDARTKFQNGAHFKLHKAVTLLSTGKALLDHCDAVCKRRAADRTVLIRFRDLQKVAGSLHEFTAASCEPPKSKDKANQFEKPLFLPQKDTWRQLTGGLAGVRAMCSEVFLEQHKVELEQLQSQINTAIETIKSAALIRFLSMAKPTLAHLTTTLETSPHDPQGLKMQMSMSRAKRLLDSCIEKGVPKLKEISFDDLAKDDEKAYQDFHKECETWRVAIGRIQSVYRQLCEVSLEPVSDSGKDFALFLCKPPEVFKDCATFAAFVRQAKAVLIECAANVMHKKMPPCFFPFVRFLGKADLETSNAEAVQLLQDALQSATTLEPNLPDLCKFMDGLRDGHMLDIMIEAAQQRDFCLPSTQEAVDLQVMLMSASCFKSAKQAIQAKTRDDNINDDTQNFIAAVPGFFQELSAAGRAALTPASFISHPPCLPV